MRRIQYLLITVGLLVFANWESRAYYRSGALDAEFLAYGQSVLAPGGSYGPGVVNRPASAVTGPREGQNGIMLERITCFGACPAYILQIDPSGGVSFWQGPPSNRRPEQTSTITAAQFHDLIAGFTAIHFFDLKDVYPSSAEDYPTVHIGLTLDGKTKKVTHSNVSPPGLEELERTIERTANIDQWLHRHPRE